MNAFFVLKSQATLNQLKSYSINMMYSSIIKKYTNHPIHYE
jgi:hypothetical protein